MSLITEFKVSLKTVEAEEIFDLVIFRPISFALVKIIYNTGITPNQISIVSMIFGILSGVFYGFGTYDFFLLGSASFFICNTLDCADGQLARLKRNGTRIGRVVDGFIDYITSVSVFLGIGAALTGITGNGWYAWVLTVAGGASKAWQNMLFDRYRNMYLEYVYNKASSINDEIKEFTEEKEKLKKEEGKVVQKVLVDAYLFYCSVQQKTGKTIKLNVSPAEYKKKNRLLLRLWSWIGSTTHMVALIVFSVLNHIEWYLFLTIAANLMALMLSLWQKNVIKQLSSENKY